MRFGRPFKLTAHQRREVLDRLTAAETQADVARSYNSRATISKIVRRASPFPDGLAAGFAA